MTRVHEAKKEHINRYKMAHMIGVAEYMRERANDYGVDGNLAYTIGLLHDIGYLEGRRGHEAVSADILKQMGVYPNLVFMIQHHGKKIRDVLEHYVCFEEDDLRLFLLLMEADASVDALGFCCGFKERLFDIQKRYGKTHPAYETMSENQKYIVDYCRENGIPK